ncbi:MAG: hypothetical protein HY675_23140 [Chloroflexi bacterium]|nr:hypothetical protein [Chloroflexota bacterium]
MRRWCNRLYLGAIAGFVTAPANVLTQVALARDVDWGFVAGLSLLVFLIFPFFCALALARNDHR